MSPPKRWQVIGRQTTKNGEKVFPGRVFSTYRLAEARAAELRQLPGWDAIVQRELPL